MGDVLIRDVPDAVVAALDALASRAGVSRNEFLRRRLAEHARVGQVSVSVADFDRISEVFADLTDPEVMAGAWD